MRLHQEGLRSWLVDKTGMDPVLVDELSALAKHSLDQLVADDVSIIAPPLICFRKDDPVALRLIGKLRDPEWHPSDDLLEQAPEVIASWLDLDADVVLRYPVGGEVQLLLGMIDATGHADDDPEAEELWRFLRVWIDSFSSRRPCTTSRVGELDDVADWLARSAVQLRRVGVTDARKVADDCLLAHDELGADGGLSHVLLLVHAGMAHTDELCRLVEGAGVLIAELGLSVDNVKLGLVADGLSVPAQHALDDYGFDWGYLSLSELGYRQYLFDEGRLDLAAESDADPVRQRWMVASPSTA